MQVLFNQSYVYEFFAILLVLVFLQPKTMFLFTLFIATSQERYQKLNAHVKWSHDYVVYSRGTYDVINVSWMVCSQLSYDSLVHSVLIRRDVWESYIYPLPQDIYLSEQDMHTNLSICLSSFKACEIVEENKNILLLHCGGHQVKSSAPATRASLFALPTVNRMKIS